MRFFISVVWVRRRHPQRARRGLGGMGRRRTVPRRGLEVSRGWRFGRGGSRRGEARGVRFQLCCCLSASLA